jgi:hypothetical protein
MEGYAGQECMCLAVSIAVIKDVALLGAPIWSLGEALISKEKPTIEP